jgi:hypothetical protein
MQPPIEELRRVGLGLVLTDAYTPAPDYVAADLELHQRWQSALPVRTLEDSRWHRNCNHRLYNLACDQFDDLLSAAAGKCQRCRRPYENLVIDHDHSIGQWGVRGLLRHNCNSWLGQVDNGYGICDAETAAYLAAPYPDRRPFPQRPRHPFHCLVGRWELAHQVPRHLQVGWASPYAMNVAIRRIKARHGISVTPAI